MVNERRLGGRNVFSCDGCGLAYADKQTADMCENYCKAHNACDPGIAAHAVSKKG